MTNKQFTPANRHVLIRILSDPQEKEAEPESLVFLPDGYKKKESEYVHCTLLAHAEDCSLNGFHEGDSIIVERSMVQKIEVMGKEFYLVLENYILGGFQS
jgi:co-chaperonin GroES (HSP10)